MSTRTTPVANDVEQMRRRLERWRERRTAGKPMPKELWTAAVKVARRHGVYATARALGLEYNKLKRLAQSTGEPQTGRPTPTFVELIAAPPVAGAHCRIEMEGPSGGRMRIELPQASAEVVVSLCRVVWSGAA